MAKEKLKIRFSQLSRKDLIFYILMAALPVTQFVLFYIGVNFNSVRLSFQVFDRTSGGYVFAGLSNFGEIINDFVLKSYMRDAAVNSLVAYAVSLVISIPLALAFSYYIFKKSAGYKLFKIFLFLPSIISSIVMTVVFRYFVELFLPTLIMAMTGVRPEGLLANPATTFGTLVFYGIWIGFGVQVLMYVGSMNGINSSVIEAAEIDGASPFAEFVRIVLPLTFPTLSVFLISGLAGLFTNQLNLFSFYGAHAEFGVYTIGYYLFKNTQSASLAEYPYLAAFGVLLTVIVIPVVFGLRGLLNKLDPTEN